jgi:hypothetical protein
MNPLPTGQKITVTFLRVMMPQVILKLLPMMSRIFIRGLWGNPLSLRRSCGLLRYLAAVWTDVVGRGTELVFAIEWTGGAFEDRVFDF